VQGITMIGPSLTNWASDLDNCVESMNKDCMKIFRITKLQQAA
jgi:hypothetical protein